MKKKIRLPDELKPFIIKNINHYFKKEKVIGNGSQGTVYLASDKSGYRYAMKVLIEDKNKPIHQIKRYVSECAALMRANHQFIIKFVGMTDMYPLTIVTAYVSHINLSKFLKKKCFAGKNDNGTCLTKIAMAVANAMMFIHSIGIIHRDLKPGNILIGEDFLPRICDFGLVRESNKPTPPTAVLGTPNWMAPEVIRGGNYTEKCDVFSYAMILFEMSTGIRPLANLSVSEILNYYADDNFRPNFPDEPEVPQPLRNLIERCWDNDPSKRPSFKKIFFEFANNKVKFSRCSSSKISEFADELISRDEKRRIIPAFKLFPKTNPKDKNQDIINKKYIIEYSSSYSADINEGKNKNSNKRSSQSPKLKISSSSESSEKIQIKKSRKKDKKEEIFQIRTLSSDDMKYRKEKKKFSHRNYDVELNQSVDSPNLLLDSSFQYSKKFKKQTIPSLHVSKSSDSYDYSDEKPREDYLKYVPLQSPAYNKNWKISQGILSDINSPLFPSELEKVDNSTFKKFLVILKNHLKSKIPHRILMLLLQKTDDLINTPKNIRLFCQARIYHFLPYEYDENDEKSNNILDLSMDILKKVFISCPEYIDEDFEPIMNILVNLKPKRAAELISIYAQSFSYIENPWPILDLLIKNKSRFFKSDGGVIIINTLKNLIQRYKNYRKNRLAYCRPIFTYFITSPILDNVIAAYKALYELYDEKFDLPFKKISSDLHDYQICDYAINLFLKIDDDIPAVKEIILSLLKLAKSNSNHTVSVCKKASKILQKMVKNIDAAEIMIVSSNWLKYQIPTYYDTFKLLIGIIKFPELRKLVAETEQIIELFSRSVIENNYKVYICYEIVLNHTNFDKRFIKGLIKNNFFINFFQGIVDLEYEDAIISSIRSLTTCIKIGYCNEYMLFYKNLQRYASKNDDISYEARNCLKVLNKAREKMDEPII